MIIILKNLCNFVQTNKKVPMDIKPLLSQEQQKELDMIRRMSYSEVNKWAKQLPKCESNPFDNAQYVDMTLEEFMQTYNLEDITNEIKKYV